MQSLFIISTISLGIAVIGIRSCTKEEVTTYKNGSVVFGKLGTLAVMALLGFIGIWVSVIWLALQ